MSKLSIDVSFEYINQTIERQLAVIEEAIGVLEDEVDNAKRKREEFEEEKTHLQSQIEEAEIEYSQYVESGLEDSIEGQSRNFEISDLADQLRLAEENAEEAEMLEDYLKEAVHELSTAYLRAKR